MDVSMDISVVTLILTSLTALAAVIGPIISSVITVKSNERVKRFEQYTPQLYAAVKRFTEAYSKFKRAMDYSGADKHRQEFLKGQAPEIYREFSAAAYDVISFVPNPEIHEMIIDLLSDLEYSWKVGTEEDKKFQEIAAAIAKDLSREMSLKSHKRISKHNKVSKSK